MKLENEIKQSKRIQSEYIRLTINLLFSGSWCNDFCNRHFKSFGLTHEQYNVLRILRGSHPKQLSVSDVQSRMIEKSSNVTRLVEKLLTKNYIHRELNPDNRRIVLLSINETGLELMENIDESMYLVEKKMENLSIEEAFTLNQLLDKLRG
jgi:DNA-binding MarR family transcriptional regulator